MGGVDTIRGIAYQHACAIAASLDVLEDSRFEAIRIEASEDIIDFELLDVHHRRVRVAQVASRACSTLILAVLGVGAQRDHLHFLQPVAMDAVEALDAAALRMCHRHAIGHQVVRVS